jgi:hypothetical protein
VRPVLIVVGLGLAQDPPQMVLIPDQDAVQEFAAASADPAFGYRVHARGPHVTEHRPDPGTGEDRVERSRVVRAAGADHELDPVSLPAEIHHQVASLLGGPLSGGVQGHSGDADAPGGVLDHGQDIGLGAVEQFRCEEVARQDRLGLGTQELRPGKRGSARRRVDSGLLENLPTPLRRPFSLSGRPVPRGSCGTPIRGSPGPAGGPGP